MNQLFDILAIISFIAFILFAFRSLESSLLIGLLIKSLIDSAWDVKFAGFSLIDLHSVFFILFSLILLNKRNLYFLLNTKFVLFWILSHLGLLFALVEIPINGIDGFARMISLPISIFIIPYFLFFSEEDNAIKLLRYLIYASLFSSIISVLQHFGIIAHEFEHLTKGLSRSNGFFHDMVTSRIYVMQGLIVLAYIKLSSKYEISDFYFWLFFILFILGGYALYSKALIGIFVAGFILLMFFSKVSNTNLYLGLVLFIFVILTNSQILESVNQLFVKEISYNEGELDDSGQLFSGRGMLWQDYIELFNNASGIEKVFGLAMNDGRTHNEFLRILILSGFFGLIFYIFFILYSIFSSIRLIISGSPLLFVTLFCLSILLIDSFSVVWGLYPFYLVTIFGFFQATLISNNIINESTNTKIRLW